MISDSIYLIYRQHMKIVLSVVCYSVIITIINYYYCIIDQIFFVIRYFNFYITDGLNQKYSNCGNWPAGYPISVLHRHVLSFILFYLYELHTQNMLL